MILRIVVDDRIWTGGSGGDGGDGDDAEKKMWKRKEKSE